VTDFEDTEKLEEMSQGEELSEETIYEPDISDEEADAQLEELFDNTVDEEVPDEDTEEEEDPDAGKDVESLLDKDLLDRVLMAILFVNDSPVPASKLVIAIEHESKKNPPRREDRLKEYNEQLADEVKAGLKRLAEKLDAENSALQIAEVAKGFQMFTRPQYADYLDRFFEKRKSSSLSAAALETLAIIAYKQPITRAELEVVRGVNVDYIVHSLLEKRLVKISGRKEVPGKPFLYKTTNFFLEYFGLPSLKELPKAEELIEAMDQHEKQAEQRSREDAIQLPFDAGSETENGEPEEDTFDGPDEQEPGLTS